MARSWIRQQLGRYAGRLRDEADDLEQQVLLELILRLDVNSFQGTSTFETYVRSFARYRCIDHYRRQIKRTFVSLDDEDLVSQEIDAQSRLERNDQIELAHAVVDHLSESCRRYWRMIYEGLSYRQMGEREGLSEATLRVRVHRCRQQATQERARLVAARKSRGT